MPIRIAEFARIFPEIFHMAEIGSWPSIETNGLMSTQALLDLYEVRGELRRHILSEHREDMVEIKHPRYGEAWIRDQKPMSDSGLEKALLDGITPKEWYEKLNGMTFFWATKKRLEKLIGARAYRNKRHCVLTIDSLSLMTKHVDRVMLSPYNSGCTKPNPFKRGKDCFLPLDRYPFDHWKSKRTAKTAVAEVVVKYSVPDILEHVIRVDEMKGMDVLSTLYQR